MSVLLDLLGSLGLGSQVMLAATLGVSGFYLLRIVSGARTVGGVLTSGVAYVVAILGAAAIAIALGWVEPSIATATEHLTTAAEWVWSVSGGYVIDFATEVLP
jgi:hypothetical protein